MKLTVTMKLIGIGLGLVFGIGGLLYPGWAGASSVPVFDPADLEYVEIDASVMIINTAQSYVVVGEKRFDVTEFKIGAEIYKTALTDAQGRDIPLKSLKPGQYVIVRGIKVPNAKGKFVADSIQVKASGNGGLKLLPKAPSIAPLNR